MRIRWGGFDCGNFTSSTSVLCAFGGVSVVGTYGTDSTVWLPRVLRL